MGETHEEETRELVQGGVQSSSEPSEDATASPANVKPPMSASYSDSRSKNQVLDNPLYKLRRVELDEGSNVFAKNKDGIWFRGKITEKETTDPSFHFCPAYGIKLEDGRKVRVGKYNVKLDVSQEVEELKGGGYKFSDSSES